MSEIVQDTKIVRVIATVAVLDEEGISFDLATVDDVLVAVRVGIEEIFANPEWRIIDAFDPHPVKRIDTFKNAGRYVDEYVEMRRECMRLRGLEAVVSGQIPDDHPLRVLERKMKIQRLAVKAIMKALLGVWPAELPGLGF